MDIRRISSPVDVERQQEIEDKWRQRQDHDHEYADNANRHEKAGALQGHVRQPR